jgi:ABC-type antimicrobial peptide transport system permease subunit
MILCGAAVGRPPPRRWRYNRPARSWDSLVGIACGVVGAVWLTPLLAAFLFGVGPGNLVAFASAVTVLTAVALVSAWITARRAARIDPLITLRES